MVNNVMSNFFIRYTQLVKHNFLVVPLETLKKYITIL